MHVYIDDSGDGGVKFGKGSTRFLVMAACIFDETEQIELLDKTLAGLSSSLHRKTEYKFHKMKNSHKTMFFNTITPIDFHVRVFVLDKALIYSPEYRESPSRLKTFAITELLTHTFGTVRDAKILIDGQDTKSHGIQDVCYIKGKINSARNRVARKIEFLDSRQSIGIQLADMIAGATRVFAENGDSRFFDTFSHRMASPRGTYWEFGKSSND